LAKASKARVFFWRTGLLIDWLYEILIANTHDYALQEFLDGYYNMSYLGEQLRPMLYQQTRISFL
jgi:hypothetical protein